MRVEGRLNPGKIQPGLSRGNRAERLGALEASFLALERPGLPMHVAAVVVLEASTDQGGPLAVDDLRRLISSRLSGLPRFSQRVHFMTP
jgi:Wax ester synthase-like Acyl-CoA acyltransferase domain